MFRRDWLTSPEVGQLLDWPVVGLTGCWIDRLLD